MAILNHLTAILSHPWAFVDNLVRTFRIMAHRYETFRVIRDIDGLEVTMRRPLDPEGPFFPLLPIMAYPGFRPHSETLPKGHRRRPYNLALPCDIVFEQDLTVPMRDGVKLYCDIYRPSTEPKVPIILVWAPYGKHGNSELFLNELPERMGIAKDMYSGYENFEGPDPAYWVSRGYAVVNIDARGSWNSEGNMYYWGNNDVFDGYDTVEFLAKQPWCSGKVGMAGNSWLAISQWFIASSQPPSLAAIAPWEGSSDNYRDTGCRGGIPNPVMSHSVGMLCPGRSLQEDQGLMSQENESWNSYWEDKRAKLGRVKCPAYVLASYSSKLHTQGSIRGWREICSQEKWLRIHNEQEWCDWPFHQDDLALFFDYYLKDIKNEWPSTPPVRLSMLRFSTTEPDVINRPLTTYPPPSLAPQTYYLNAQKRTANSNTTATGSTVSYPAADMKSEVTFDITFTKYTELAGYAKLTLWMQCHDHDDMDIFVLLGKASADGKLLRHVNYSVSKVRREDLPLINVVQYQGPTGMLKASHRKWETRHPSYQEAAPLRTGSKAKAEIGGDAHTWDGKRELWHPHLVPEKIPKGEIVKCELTTWPLGMIFDEGEKMRVRISGRDMCLIEADVLPINPTQNVGTHILHTGGKYDSNIILPVINA